MIQELKNTLDEIIKKEPKKYSRKINEYKKNYKIELHEYETQQKYHIMTTRFNNKTYSENQQYLAKLQSQTDIKCIYSTPIKITPKIQLDRILFIIEMNNDANRIEGIGLIKNRYSMKTAHTIYENRNYNRYTYIGNHRIDRSEFTEEEKEVIKEMEILCFKGKRHLKRGQGLQMFPLYICYLLSNSLFPSPQKQTEHNQESINKENPYNEEQEDTEPSLIPNIITHQKIDLVDFIRNMFKNRSQ